MSARTFVALGLVLAACERGPLPFGSGDGGGDDAGTADAARPRPGVLDWAVPVGVGEPTGGSTVVAAAVATGDGGVIVAGVFSGAVRFATDTILVASGSSTGFVARYRRDQRLVWARPLSSATGRMVVADLAPLGDDEVVVTGWFEGTVVVPEAAPSIVLESGGGLDLFVGRIAADGSTRWMVRAGGPGDDIARSVSSRSMSDGRASIAIAGAVGGAIFTDRGGSGESALTIQGPIFVARLDGDGQAIWVRYAGTGVPGQAYGVAIDDGGAVVATGYTNGRAHFGVDAAGQVRTVDPADGRAFLARWGPSGALEWAESLGGPEGEGDVVAVGGAREIFVAGTFEGEARFGMATGAPRLTADRPDQPGAFLAAFGATGAPSWARRLVGVGMRPWRLRIGRGGELLVAAAFSGGIVADPEGPRPLLVFSSGNSDALFMRLGPDGALSWATAGGGLGDDTAADFVVASDAAGWGVGNYVGPASFGAGSPFGAGAAATLDSGTAGGGFLLRLAF